MIDIHLINVALAGLGIGTGAVVLLAAAVIAIAAILQHGTRVRSRKAPTSAVTAPRLARPARRGLALR
jgi:hypothetical protein